MAIAPLQLPGYAAPQTLDFTSLANLGQVYTQAKDSALEKQTLANLGRGQDGKIDTAPLINSGNLKLSQLGIQIDQKQQEQDRQARLDQRQTSRDAVDDRFREESLRLQKAAAARAAEDKFTIKEITDPNTGATTLVRVKTTGGEGPIPLGLPSASGGGNPFGPGKFNEGQGKAAGFTDRMLQSEGILSGVGGQGGVQGQGTSAVQTALSAIPGVGNYLTSADRQKYEQAKRDFINAQLRRESGAAISPTEFDSANKQYFPTPGDSAEVIQQKSANRRAAIEALGREGGPSYKPKYTFDEGGRVTPYGQPKPSQASGPISKAQYDSLPSGSTFTAPDGSVRVKP